MSFIEGVKKALSRLSLLIKSRIYIMRNKDYSVGLFFWIEQKLKHDIWKRLPSETPRAFLFRVQKELKDMDKNIDLTAIAFEVESTFYSTKKELPKPIDGAKTIRKEISKLVLERKTRALLNRIKQSFSRKGEVTAKEST